MSLDCESTGLDLVHGARPFLVTTCNTDSIVTFWEWTVDPLTRKPNIPLAELIEIQQLINSAELIYLQNAKFDVRMLASVGVELPWPKVRDTLVMGHLLASNHPHNLTSMCSEYLRRDINRYELDIKAVTKQAHLIVKRNYPNWKIAQIDDDGELGMPSVSKSGKRDDGRPWKTDMWLPAALAVELSLSVPDSMCKHEWDGDKADHHTRCTKCGGSFWHIACSQYANTDSRSTIALGLQMEKLIRQRGLWAIYEHRLNLPRIACEMESYGVTVVGSYTESTIQDYELYIAEANSELCGIAAQYNYDLHLAKGAGVNDNMREFFYGSKRKQCPRCDYNRVVKHWNGEDSEMETWCSKCLKTSKRPFRAGSEVVLNLVQRDNLNLESIEGKNTSNASLDKGVLAQYLATTSGDAHDFIKILIDKRKLDTDLMYMNAYRRFWVPVYAPTNDGYKHYTGYYRIHPSLNPCATDHLRWSSNSPNLQNIGRQEDECERCEGKGCNICNGTGKSRTSVRYCFGPAPGREWYSIDFRSIERRIPVYECGEPKMVEVFEKPDEPPYWGSLYYLTASVLYSKEFWPLSEFSIDSPEGFKHKHKRLYKQSKFFDLGKQYGCGRAKGDLLSGITDSFDLVDNEFPLFAALQLKYLRFAEKNGYVETLPNTRIDKTKGYPILAKEGANGRVLSTTPFNYHVSGTACDVKNSAAILCSNQLAQWRQEGFDGHMALEIHDELLFDFPKHTSGAWDGNLWRAHVLRNLMQSVGDDLIPHIPLPVSVEYHSTSWAEGRSC